MLFARLKDMGIPAEFICEEARIYIARMRYEKGLEPSDPLSLSDEDQMNIMEGQLTSEDVMSTVCGPDLVIVTDSSPLNSLLYMSQECRERSFVSDMIGNCRADVVFYLPPVSMPKTLDPNRVHGEAASRAIDSLIPEVIAKFAPEVHMFPLVGDPANRLSQAVREVLKRFHD